MWNTLWTDEGGAIISTELVLIMTILGFGGIVGSWRCGTPLSPSRPTWRPP